MARTPNSREGIRRWALQDPDRLEHDELVSAVCKYFCRGMTVAEIRTAIREKLHVDLKREEPYRLLSTAAQRGWLRFHAPQTIQLAEEIAGRYPWLQEVKVVRTGVSDDISYHVAETLLDHVCRLSKARPQSPEVHIGFAGGIALRKTARAFSEMLQVPRGDLPRRIVFHAMVAGFNVADPSTDPNGFFTYFAGESALQVQTAFWGLPIPGIERTEEINILREIPYIKEAFSRSKDIDIVVTSAGGHWQQGHSGLCTMLGGVSPLTVDQLNNAGCIGDVMWRPVGKFGPLGIRTEMRTVTLLELDDLPDFIRCGKSVLLLVGPCGRCGGPKHEVLAAILSKRNLISHLVVDSRSARGLVQAASL